MRQVLRKLLSQRLDGPLRVRCRHNETNVVLRRRLRNQQHVRTHFRRRRKGPSHHIRQSHNPRPAYADQRNILNRRQRFHSAADASPFRRYLRARSFRRKAVSDPHRNRRLHYRLQRFRMQHLRSKKGQLCRFAVRDHRNRSRLRHQPRVRRQHAVDVRPDDHFIRIQRRAQNCRRIIRPAAPQRRQFSFRRRSEKSRYDRHDSLLKHRPQPHFAFFPRPVHQRFRASVELIRNNYFRRIHRLALQAKLPHRTRHQRCGQPFP